MRCEQAQLAGGTAPLAIQPGGGQTGFRDAIFGDLDPAGVNFSGDPFKDYGALFAGGGRLGREGGRCGAAGSVNRGGGACRECAGGACGG